MKLADRLALIKPPSTHAIAHQARELRAQGRDVINMGVGEPDFDTPLHVQAAAIDAINNGCTRYTPIDGTNALKSAIAQHYQEQYDLAYDANQIIVSCGAKQSLYNLCQALLQAGDEVLVPAPYWVSYPDIARLAGANAKPIHTCMDERFKISPESLQQAISANTRLLILNSPSNPSGTAYSSDEFKALGSVLADHPNVMIAYDAMYQQLTWTDDPVGHFPSDCPELSARTICVDGVSKAYAMTGWRIGYALGPAELIAGMKKVQAQSTSNPCSISQAASVAALQGPQDSLVEMREAFKQRHDKLTEGLNSLPGVRTLQGDGTFFCFADVQGLMRETGCESDIDLSSRLLEDQFIATVPGTAFGCPGHIRLSFAVSMSKIDEVLTRLALFCQPGEE